MPRRIWHDSAGRFGVIDSNVPAALVDPTANRGAVYFSAAHDYLQIAYDQTRTITFPARGAGDSWADWTTFPAHNLGVVPWAVLRVNTKQLPAGAIIQGGAHDDMRCLYLRATPTAFVVRERWVCDDGNGTPAITLSLRIVAYKVAPSGSHTKKAHFTPDGRLRLGFGKFDTNQRYLREAPANLADFWITSGRTIDTNFNTLRQVLPNGEVLNIGAYPGSFAGTGFWGVAD